MSVYDHDARIQISDDLGRILRDLDRVINEGVKAVAKEVAKRAKNTAAFVDDTGILRKSIKAQKSKFRNDDNTVDWIVKAGAPHAHLVEYGHASYVGGQRIEDHTPGHPFLQKAVDEVEAEAERIVAEHLNRLDIKV